MIRSLVINGFGSYEVAARADLIDAAIFLYLANDVDARVERFLRS